MKNVMLMLGIILISATLSIAQQYTSPKGSDMCSHRKMQNSQLVARTFRSANAPKHAFDVQKYTINIDLVNCLTSPYPNNFAADVTILFRTDSVLNQIVLDADGVSLTIDSVRLKGTSFTHTNDKLTIELNRTYNPGELAEVQVFYRHNDVADGAFYASGGFAYTDCEPEGARKWFPCYDSPADKATSDITAKVPLTTKLGSNGRLQDSINDGNSVIYHWISRDPIATYLFVITANNNFNLDIVNWTNPNTSEVIPIRFYFNNGENMTKLAYVKSIIGDMTTFYSQEFGDHPFEKNGFATLNDEFAWGGMENQTLTSLCPNCWDEYYIAHEFAHQWFGDMITCATWADIFLNEGFATWAEAHWTENTSGYSAYKNELYGNAQYYFMGNPQWAISTPSWAVTTPGTGTLFNYSITYMKGSCVMHMLRYTLGDDVFFPALKAYATDTTDFKYKSATIEDFKNKMESETGQDLDWFFDEWIYKPNHPIYQNVYGIYSGSKGNWSVQFKAGQEEQAFLPYFQMPIELKINFADGSDSIVRVFNGFNGQNFAFEFNKEPTLVIFDPNNDILLKEGATILGLDEVAENNTEYRLKAFPNPFTSKTQFTFELAKPEQITLELHSNSGVKLKMITDEYLSSGAHTFELGGEGLRAGIYFIVLRTPGHVESEKIIKTL